MQDLLVPMWDCVSQMVKVARKASTTKSEQQSFVAAALTRRCWRALNTEGNAGSAATQDWRPTVWTHVFLCHLPKPWPSKAPWLPSGSTASNTGMPEKNEESRSP